MAGTLTGSPRASGSVKGVNALVPNPVATNYIRGNATGDTYEVRTPTQVLTDIGASTTADAAAMAIALG